MMASWLTKPKTSPVIRVIEAGDQGEYVGVSK